MNWASVKTFFAAWWPWVLAGVAVAVIAWAIAMDWSIISASIAVAWGWYGDNREDLTPIGALLGGSLIAWAALRQVGIASRQAGIAARRHYAQTEADLQRRITESYGKAVEQLSGEKIEQRLGGIYTLERISRESPADYWTIMETLTAFVRERARWKEPEGDVPETMARFYGGDQQGKVDPPTDVAAVLTVIKRRDGENRAREEKENWIFDFKGCDLRRANLSEAHLERANLFRAHLDGAHLGEAHLGAANLGEAHLDDAYLGKAHLERANLFGAHLDGAYLGEAHLGAANLGEAHLERANLVEAHLGGAYLNEAHLGGAFLFGAHLERAFLFEAYLAGADLSRARLDGANLSEARLDGANLSEAHLGGANLSGADLTVADLRGALNLTQAQLDQAYGQDVNLDPPLTLDRPVPSWPVPS